MSETETVSILGGGWSARSYDRARLPGTVIGVNDAAVLAPCNFAVSMDRLWTEHRLADLYGRAGFGFPALAFIRRSALQNVEEVYDFVRPFENDNTSVDFAEASGRVGAKVPTATLNGTNSGMCALNLAYQMRPRRVILFGFDMNRSPDGAAYWFPDYPWAKPGGATSPGKYRAWAAEFAIARRQFEAVGVEVLNASLVTAIDAFPKIDPEEVLR